MFTSFICRLGDYVTRSETDIIKPDTKMLGLIIDKNKLFKNSFAERKVKKTCVHFLSIKTTDNVYYGIIEHFQWSRLKF